MGWQVWPSIHDDVALPALTLTNVVEDRNPGGRLHDAAKTTAAVSGAEFRQSDSQTTVRQRAILGAIVAIHAGCVVTNGTFCTPRRRLGVIFAAGAAGQIEFAGLRCLHQREAKVSIFGGNLLSLRGCRRDAPIGRIGNHRRAPAGALHGPKGIVVGAGDIGLATARVPLIATAPLRAQAVEFRPLSVGEKFLVRKSRRAL